MTRSTVIRKQVLRLCREHRLANFLNIGFALTAGQKKRISRILTEWVKMNARLMYFDLMDIVD